MISLVKDDGVRNWSDVATNQGIIKMLGERLGVVSSSEPPEGTSLADTLLFGLLTS